MNGNGKRFALTLILIVTAVVIMSLGIGFALSLVTQGAVTWGWIIAGGTMLLVGGISKAINRVKRAKGGEEKDASK